MRRKGRGPFAEQGKEGGRTGGWERGTEQQEALQALCCVLNAALHGWNAWLLVSSRCLYPSYPTCQLEG